MADGSSKPIEEIKKGDLVIAYDFDKDGIVEREVTETYSNYTFWWQEIVVDGGGEVIRATLSHRFWVESVQDWLAAKDLEVGMTLLNVDGDIVSIISVSPIEIDESEATFNLEIAHDHNYFVG